MKAGQAHHIFSVIQGGDFTGPERKPMGRVTVDQHWRLNLGFGPIGAYPANRLPVRWWVSTTTAWKNETEVPNVKTIKCDWSLDQDAATATIVFYNTLMDPITSGGLVGNPGALTPDRGKVTNRWGHTTNVWEDAIVEGALLRSYSGYGGFNADGSMKSIAACLAGGYIVQTGTWMIDDVRITSDGLITCICRDMMALLIDQPFFPPLVPSTWYPGDYRRYGQQVYDTPRVDYGVRVGGAKKIVGCGASPTVTDATGHDNEGYWLCGDDGGVFALGTAHFYGANVSQPSKVVGMAANPSRNGYWLGLADGQLLAFGGAVDFGEFIIDQMLPGPDPRSPYVAITAPRPPPFSFGVNGVYMVTSVGEIGHAGSATFYGGIPTTPAPIVGIASRPLADGYWLVNRNGQVYAYGSAPYLGNTPNDTGHPTVAIVASNSGNGYIIVDDAGNVYSFGDAPYSGGTGAIALTDPISSIMLTPDGAGYWLVAQDGGVFAFGSAVFYGSLVKSTSFDVVTDGTYLDFSDIIRDLVLFSGFWLHNTTDDAGMPAVYGSIESTGSFATDIIPADLFDKQAIIDCITKIKEVVGFSIAVEADGSFSFRSPNWWGPGNFLPDGSHTAFIPVIDEKWDLIAYGVQRSQRSDRTNIIISTDDPTANLSNTVTTNLVLPSNGFDRGMFKPTMLFNPLFNSALDQEIMAELIALHILFQRRLGSVTCVCNPLIDLDDQVQIFEEQSEEMWTHHVRGISTEQDLDEGSYIATYTTAWLGDATSWTIVRPDGIVDVP